MRSEYTHVILNLFAVMVLIYGLFFLLKKFKLAKYSTDKQMNIVNMVSIGAKEKIILLEVNNVMLLVGATPNQIATLHVFDAAESKKSSALEDSQQNPTFSEQMKELTS